MKNVFSGIYNGKRVLVTGHTGFKGSWLVQWLTMLGAEVYGYSQKPPTEPNHYDLLDCKDVVSCTGAIENYALFVSFLQEARPDILFHLAAQPLVRNSYKSPLETFNVNCMGTVNVLEALRQSGVEASAVMITTDKVYENREWDRGYNECDPLGGHDPYSASKACAEIIIQSYRRSFFTVSQRNLVASARAGNVIGGGDWATDRLIPDLVTAAVTGGKVRVRNPDAIRPWQHVLDCLSGYLMIGQRLLERNVKCADAWNFGPADSDTLTVADVISVVKGGWPELCVECVDDQRDFHETHTLKLDCSKSSRDLEWKPVWVPRTSIERTIDWYKDYYYKNQIITTLQLQQFVQDAHSLNCIWTR